MKYAELYIFYMNYGTCLNEKKNIYYFLKLRFVSIVFFFFISKLNTTIL